MSSKKRKWSRRSDDDIKSQRSLRIIINDIVEYLSESCTVGRRNQRENLMAEAATAMRSVIKIETWRKISEVFLRATHINIVMESPNLEDDIPSLQRNPMHVLLSLSLSSLLCFSHLFFTFWIFHSTPRLSQETEPLFNYYATLLHYYMFFLK